MLHLLIIGRHSNINQGTCWTSNLKTQKVHILSKKFEIRSILVQAAISMLQRHSTFHVIFLKNAIWWPEKNNVFIYLLFFLSNQKKNKVYLITASNKFASNKNSRHSAAPRNFSHVVLDGLHFRIIFDLKNLYFWRIDTITFQDGLENEIWFRGRQFKSTHCNSTNFPRKLFYFEFLKSWRSHIFPH